MTTDGELSLENEQLTEYLDTAPTPQPVVVVQYRNRGIPSWIFFSLLVVVPIATIVAYHRLVVEQYRAQTAEASRVLDTIVDHPRAASPAKPEEPVAATSVIVHLAPPDAGAPPVAGASTAAGSAQPGAAAATPPAGAPSATAPLVATSPAPAAATGASKTEVSIAAPSSPQPGGAGGGGVPPPPQPALGAADPMPRTAPAAGALAAGKEPKAQRLRSILGNPFAEDDEGPAAARKKGSTSPAPPGSREIELATALPSAVGGARPGSGGKDDPDSGPLPHAAGQPPPDPHEPGDPALQPLPSREENLRQFEEEAARTRLEMVEKKATREAAARATRLEERLKFRQELREVLALHGTGAHAEIDKLTHRYGYDIDAERAASADRIWRFGQRSQKEKVRVLRERDLPEAVILDFLSNDLQKIVKARNGPRNEDEVRVRAALLLLSYELPGEGPGARPGSIAAPVATPARAPAPRAGGAAFQPR